MEEEKIKENVKGEEVSKSYDFSNSPDSTKKYILFEKTKTLYTIIYPKLNLFPKSERFTLRQRIEELILDSIKLLIKQNYKTNNDEINNVKDKEEEKKKMMQKVYKPLNINNNNMLPGDPKGSPDESFFSRETLIFIDANFLSKLSKHFGKGDYLIYDLIKFSNYLTRKQKLNCKDIYYYTAPPFQSPMPTKEEEKKKDGYDRFVKKLRDKGVIVREGRCQRLKIDGKFSYSQKAVDVFLAMDLTNVPIKYPNVKRIILISTDSDFVPVIKNLNDNGVKTILYTYYEKIRNTPFSRSNHLIKSVYKYVLLGKDDFIKSPLIK